MVTLIAASALMWWSLQAPAKAQKTLEMFPAPTGQAAHRFEAVEHAHDVAHDLKKIMGQKKQDSKGPSQVRSQRRSTKAQPARPHKAFARPASLAFAIPTAPRKMKSTLPNLVSTLRVDANKDNVNVDIIVKQSEGRWPAGSDNLPGAIVLPPEDPYPQLAFGEDIPLTLVFSVLPSLLMSVL